MRYIELIVLLNILIHVCFIKLSNFIMNKRNNWLFIIFSIIIDIIYVIFSLLFPEKIKTYKYLMIILIAIFPFVCKQLSTTIISSIIYLMFNFILGGFSEILIKIINHYVSVLLCLIIINISFSIFVFYKNKHFKNDKFLYQIIITDNKKTYKIMGYCDTGNFLKTDNNIPIIFLNDKFSFGKFYKSISIMTVKNIQTISIYKIESFKIKINDKFIEKDVYVSYSKIRFDCLFGLELIGG